MRNFVSHSSSCLATTVLELLKPLKSPTATTAAATAATTKNVKVITFSNHKNSSRKILKQSNSNNKKQKISAAAAVDIPSDAATGTATVVATSAHANFFCCPVHRCVYESKYVYV